MKPVRVLSGGEKSRLSLVKLLLDPPNFLLMDEPTTHLDMASIEALVAALQQFEGTLVFISHDVYFIRELAKQVVHVENGSIRKFSGNYDYYVEKTKQTSPGQSYQQSKAPLKAFAGNNKEARRAQAEQRQVRNQAKKTQQGVVAEIEKKIALLEKRQEEINESLQDSKTYEDTILAAELNKELKTNKSQLDELHAKWEEEASRLEELTLENRSLRNRFVFVQIEEKPGK